MTPTTPAQDAVLTRFAELVASSPHNLVSRRAREELRTRHIPECVALATLLPTGTRRLLDVGSGGGFPGLVIASSVPNSTSTSWTAPRRRRASSGTRQMSWS
jgi:16S rRNA (guanine527-N7)-methyltransferase